MTSEVVFNEIGAGDTLSRRLRRAEEGRTNRLRSIIHDQAFVRERRRTWGEAFPVFANLRAGAWYCDPRDSGVCHFKVRVRGVAPA